jgi:hypothetical protein
MRTITRTIAALSLVAGVLFSGGIAPSLYFTVYLLSVLNFHCLYQYQPGHPATDPTCRMLDSLNDKLSLQQLSHPHTNNHH